MQEMNDQIPTLEQLHAQLWKEIRVHRNGLLKTADIKINVKEDAGTDATTWRTYRKKLRDMPTTTADPTKVVWPKKPAK